MTTYFPEEHEAKEKYESVKKSSLVQKIKKSEVDAAEKDLIELVQKINHVGLTDTNMLNTLKDFGHSHAAIRAAEARLVNNKTIIGKSISEDPVNPLMHIKTRYFLNNNYTGEKNGENTYKR